MRLTFRPTLDEESVLASRIAATPYGGTLQFKGIVRINFGPTNQYHNNCPIGIHTLSLLTHLDVRQTWHIGNQKTNIPPLHADFACCIIPRVEPVYSIYADTVYVAGHRFCKRANTEYYLDDNCRLSLQVIDDADNGQSTNDIRHYIAKYVIANKYLDKLLHQKCADQMGRMEQYNFNHFKLIDVLPELKNRLRAFNYNINVGIGQQFNVVGDPQLRNEVVFAEEEVTHSKFLEYNAGIFDEILSTGFGIQHVYTARPLPIPNTPENVEEILKKKTFMAYGRESVVMSGQKTKTAFMTI